MRLDKERLYRERSFYRVEIVQPKGPMFLPTFIRTLLGDRISVGGDFSKENAQKKVESLRDIYKRNPNNKHIVRIKNIFG